MVREWRICLSTPEVANPLVALRTEAERMAWFQIHGRACPVSAARQSALGAAKNILVEICCGRALAMSTQCAPSAANPTVTLFSIVFGSAAALGSPKRGVRPLVRNWSTRIGPLPAIPFFSRRLLGGPQRCLTTPSSSPWSVGSGSVDVDGVVQRPTNSVFGWRWVVGSAV